jgi:hypothetical protein
METTFAPVQSAMRSNSNIAESLLGPSSGGGGGGNSSSRDDDGSGRRSDTFEMTVHSNESKDDPVIGHSSSSVSATTTNRRSMVDGAGTGGPHRDLHTRRVSHASNAVGPDTGDNVVKWMTYEEIMEVFKQLNVVVESLEPHQFDPTTATSMPSQSDIFNCWAVTFAVDRVDAMRGPNRVGVADKYLHHSIYHQQQLSSRPIERSLPWLLHAHYDIVSVGAIAKYATNSNIEHFNSTTDRELFGHKKQLKFEDVQILVDSSTYYLLSEEALLRIFSFVVSVLQITVLLVVIGNLSGNAVVRRDLAERMIIIFILLPLISLYIAGLSVTSLSEQSMFLATTFYEQYSPPGYRDNFIVGAAFFGLSFLLAPVGLLYYGVSGSRMAICVLFEYSMSVISLFAVSSIISAQSDIITILFNFTGVVVVLDVDSKIAQWLQVCSPQSHLAYRSDGVIKNGWAILLHSLHDYHRSSGQSTDSNVNIALRTRRGLGIVISVVFFFVLTSKFTADQKGAS